MFKVKPFGLNIFYSSQDMIKVQTVRKAMFSPLHSQAHSIVNPHHSQALSIVKPLHSQAPP